MLNATSATKAAILDFPGLVALLDGNHSARFISLLYRAKETGEVARHTLLLNVSRRNCLVKDLEKLNALRPTLTGIMAQACDELIASVQASLAGDNPNYTKQGYYEGQGHGNVQVSVKDVCYIRGYSVKKEVIVPGVYKEVKSRPLTVAKNQIRRTLRNTRCREFIITPANFVMARHDGKAIVIETTGTSLNKAAGLPPVTVAIPVPA